MRRVGAHLSIAGGLSKAVESSVKMGGSCLQIFSSSPRMWTGGKIKKEEAKRFKSLCVEHDVKPVFIHAKYLVNLVSNRQEVVEKSIKSLQYDLEVGRMIGAKGVIVHLGSHLGLGFDKVKSDLVKRMKQVLKAGSDTTGLVIENSAGQKGKIASRFEEIRLLIQAVGSKRVSWCLDTCHAWSAGLSLEKVREKVMQFDILNRLVCLHVNDSRDGFGSGRDRHANLGQGKIGEKVLKQWVNDRMFKRLPLIIETPGFMGGGPDKKNLDILKRLVGEK